MPAVSIGGKTKKYEKPVSGIELAKDFALEGKALAIKVNGELKDLSQTIDKDAQARLLTFEDEEGKKVFWHTSAHVLASAVKKLYPQALATIGPAIDSGFYYDFDNLKISEQDFEKIEKKMQETASQNLECRKKEITVDEAREMFKNNRFKLELIEELAKEDKKITVYSIGDFTDLCEGPHLPDTSKINAVKILSTSTAYWRGDIKGKALTRIYAVSFPAKEELDAHLKLLKEIEARDHRKIGKDLDLFSFNEMSPGSPFIHAKGAVIWNTLTNFIKEENRKRGYDEVITPQVYDRQLWETSGHWNYYRENMFLTKLEGRQFALKPMNCPGDVLIYKTKSHSYRDLPIKAADFGMLHRNEISGVFSGLLRVRRLVQDDAHIFCTPEQMQEEITALIKYARYVYEKIFNFDYEVELSTKPEKSIGSADIWQKAEKTLEAALKKSRIKYATRAGEGAFYGPKIDFHIKDALGRKWQCATIQLDFNLPERFNLNYMDKDSQYKQVIMIHRTILGTFERFTALLTEHYAGKFPAWLSPVQARVLPVSDKFEDYAEEIFAKFKKSGIRTEIDDSSETLGKKIRKAELDKVNYIIVVGAKEQENKTINIRSRDKKTEGEKKTDSFIRELKKEIRQKK